MALSAREKLNTFYSQFSSDDHVLVLINADPDAMASAMAIKRLLWRKTNSIEIAHINIVDRPDNLTMIRLLSIKMKLIRHIDRTKYTRIVMVDSQPDHNDLFKEFTPHVIIDHHPDSGTLAGYKDIRPKYGATASIMTEYLKAAKIKPSIKLATALFYGIKTDTNNFERQPLMEDLRAFQFLFRHTNIALARRIEQTELRINYLKYFSKALEEKCIRKERVFVHLGSVNTPDVCVVIADFFMRIESVNWAVVSGIYGKKLVIIFRNDGIRSNAGTIAQKAFCAFGSAGGHKSAARAEIPLSNIESLNTEKDKKVLSWIMATFDKGTKIKQK